MRGIDGNILQCPLEHLFILVHVGVHEYNTTYSVDVECRALYRVQIHYASVHNAKFISITYDWYDCTSTLLYSVVQVYNNS